MIAVPDRSSNSGRMGLPLSLCGELLTDIPEIWGIAYFRQLAEFIDDKHPWPGAESTLCSRPVTQVEPPPSTRLTPLHLFKQMVARVLVYRGLLNGKVASGIVGLSRSGLYWRRLFFSIWFLTSPALSSVNTNPCSPQSIFLRSNSKHRAKENRWFLHTISSMPY